MTHIGPLDLKEKAAVIAVILEKPLETSKKAAENGADILEIRLDLLGIRDRNIAAETIRKVKSETGLPNNYHKPFIQRRRKMGWARGRKNWAY